MIQVTEATIDHLDQLIPLFDGYRVFYKKPSNEAAARSFLSDRINNKESIIYMAFEDGNAVGFTQLYPLFSSTRMNRLWLLNDLFVDANHRGKGASKMLINKAQELTKSTGAAALILETEISNIIGNKLYPTVGFELDTEHNHYYWEHK